MSLTLEDVGFLVAIGAFISVITTLQVAAVLKDYLVKKLGEDE